MCRVPGAEYLVQSIVSYVGVKCIWVGGEERGALLLGLGIWLANDNLLPCVEVEGAK